MYERRCWIKTILAGFIFFGLFSCTKPSRGWELTTVTAIFPCSTYVKARLPPTNAFNGIEVECLGAEGDIDIYLNAFTLSFPASDCDGEMVDVDLTIDGKAYRFAFQRMLGGQRIKMSDEAKELVMSTLLEDIPITLSIGRYQSEIIPNYFQKAYSRLSMASKY